MYVAKTKVLISCAVRQKKHVSYDIAHIIFILILWVLRKIRLAFYND